MAEYIDREAAIKSICHEKCRTEYGECQKGKHDDKIILCVCDFLRFLPAVSVPQWISVKDRLPEDGENVLIWYEYFRYGSYNRMYKTYEIAYQYDGFWSGVNPLGQKARVFAWMPLPEPPKGENDG